MFLQTSTGCALTSQIYVGIALLARGDIIEICLDRYACIEDIYIYIDI